MSGVSVCVCALHATQQHTRSVAGVGRPGIHPTCGVVCLSRGHVGQSKMNTHTEEHHAHTQLAVALAWWAMQAGAGPLTHTQRCAHARQLASCVACMRND